MTYDELLEKLLDHLEEITSIEDALAIVRDSYAHSFEQDPDLFEQTWFDHHACLDGE